MERLLNPTSKPLGLQRSRWIDLECRRAGFQGGFHTVSSGHDFATAVEFVKRYTSRERELVTVQVHVPASRFDM